MTATASRISGLLWTGLALFAITAAPLVAVVCSSPISQPDRAVGYGLATLAMLWATIIITLVGWNRSYRWVLLGERSSSGVAIGLSAHWLSGFCNDWLLRGNVRTFGQFHCGVVTAYALEVGAARQGDNRDPSFSALRALRYPIHEIPPNFFTRNSELQFLFHSSVLSAGPSRAPRRSCLLKASRRN
jgi:hypothetical protein